jgi:putative pyruvate formate lyase activating enzyme
MKKKGLRMTGELLSKASYLELAETGELSRRAGRAIESLSACTGCAWKCGVDRLFGDRGRCGTGLRALVSHYGPHLGEEDPLRGWRGSGTIFFSRCNLACRYCQNADISQAESGFEVSPQHLAAIMLQLQKEGCHNLNLVSPSHVVPQILAALSVAVDYGLTIPLVYNTGGYDSLETLALLDGVVDIYLPDMKYSDPACGERYSLIPDYPQVNQAAVREMHRQVGDLFINQQGLATSGLLVRHLVLPSRLAGSQGVLNFLANEVSRNTYLNLMDQYRPAYQAAEIPELNRPLTRAEYQEVVQWAHEAGLYRLDHRNRLL